MHLAPVPIKTRRIFESVDIRRVRGKILACFSRPEIVTLLKTVVAQDIYEDIKKQGIPAMFNPQNVIKGAQKLANDRDIHEVFLSAYVYLDFYENPTGVCFELKDTFNPHKDGINSLVDLNRFRKTDSDFDFVIETSEGMIKFQHKRYQDALNTEAVFNFIIKKIRKYGNDLGDTNLLITLQPRSNKRPAVDFEKLHKDLSSQNFKFEGNILISYNDANKERVMIEVYPNLEGTKIPHHRPSEINQSLSL